jgi:hypothetical protein
MRSGESEEWFAWLRFPAVRVLSHGTLVVDEPDPPTVG